MSEICDDKLKEILTNVTGPEGFVKLILDTENEIDRSVKKISAHEKEIARINRMISETRGSLQAFEKMLEILKHLHGKWGLNEIGLVHSMAILTNEKGEPEKRDIKEKVETVNPETKKRKEAGKFCMYKDRETKKWCQRRLSGKMSKETGYCKTHREMLYGNDEK